MERSVRRRTSATTDQALGCEPGSPGSLWAPKAGFPLGWIDLFRIDVQYDLAVASTPFGEESGQGRRDGKPTR